MSDIQQIQCPACGANSTFKQKDGSYMCNYCQSTFELKDNIKPFQPQRKTITTPTPNLNPARAVGLTTIMIAVALIGVGLSVFVSLKTSGANKDVDSIFSDWQKPSLSIYQSFVGSKGPVIWEISQQTRNKLDSAKYNIEIIDPKIKSVLFKAPVLETMTWAESFNFSKKLDGQFFQIGDIAYNCSEENGLIGFNIYDFSKQVTEETLGKTYPELSSGISKANYMWYKKAFNLATNKGVEFVYYPEKKLLRSKTKDDNSYRSDTLTETKIYLSDQKQAQLYLIRRKGDKSRDELDVDDNIVSNYDKEKNYYKSSYHISLFKKLSERVFFKSQPIMRINNSMVFVYVDDLSKKAKVHLECVDQEGKTLWENGANVLQELKNNNSDRLSFEYRHNNEFITISIWGAKRKTHCFDLKTGKLVWSYSPEN